MVSSGLFRLLCLTLYSWSLTFTRGQNPSKPTKTIAEAKTHRTQPRTLLDLSVTQSQSPLRPETTEASPSPNGGGGKSPKIQRPSHPESTVHEYVAY